MTGWPGAGWRAGWLAGVARMGGAGVLTHSGRGYSVRWVEWKTGGSKSEWTRCTCAEQQNWAGDISTFCRDGLGLGSATACRSGATARSSAPVLARPGRLFGIASTVASTRPTQRWVSGTLYPA